MFPGYPSVLCVLGQTREAFSTSSFAAHSHLYHVVFAQINAVQNKKKTINFIVRFTALYGVF